MTALGKFMKGLKDYNIFELLKILFALSIIAFIVTFAFNPALMLDKLSDVVSAVSDRKKDEHMDLFYRRMEADKKIRGYLTGLLESSGADRAWVFEPHNGSSNLASGLPFIYMDLTMEVVADGVNPISGDYKDIRLSNYQFSNVLFSEGYWWGDMVALYDIDTKLWHRMTANDVTQMAVVMMWDGREPLGCVGLTWTSGHGMTDPEKVGRLIRQTEAKTAVELIIAKR